MPEPAFHLSPIILNLYLFCRLDCVYIYRYLRGLHNNEGYEPNHLQQKNKFKAPYVDCFWLIRTSAYVFCVWINTQRCRKKLFSDLGLWGWGLWGNLQKWSGNISPRQVCFRLAQVCADSSFCSSWSLNTPPPLNTAGFRP